MEQSEPGRKPLELETFFEDERIFIEEETEYDDDTPLSDPIEEKERSSKNKIKNKIKNIKEKTLNVQSQKVFFELSIDSEYYFENKMTKPISIQGVFKYKEKKLKIIVLNRQFEKSLDEKLITLICEERQIEYYYDSFEDDEEPLILKYFHKYLEYNDFGRRN